MFKQAVVARDWKAQAGALLDLLQGKQGGPAVGQALTKVALKIMAIPPKQHDSASQLIAVFCKLYEQLLRQASVLQSVQVHALLNEHLEDAFKLTTRQEPHFKARAYQWLEALVDCCPKSFWADRKRRTVKAIFTHAIDICRQSAQTSAPEESQLRENALKIVLKFQEITRWRDFDDYALVIQNNLLTMLQQDRREQWRYLILKHLNWTEMAPEALGLVAIRSLDQSKRVRLSFYEKLQAPTDLMQFCASDRLSILKNGLSDVDSQI